MKSYSEICEGLTQGKIYLLRRFKGCNHGWFAYIKTVAQFDSLVRNLYTETSEKHKAFTEYSRLNPVSDGSVFWFNAAKLSLAEGSQDLNDLWGYVMSIENFPCSKVEIEEVSPDDPQVKYVSEYYETLHPRS